MTAKSTKYKPSVYMNNDKMKIRQVKNPDIVCHHRQNQRKLSMPYKAKLIKTNKISLINYPFPPK